MANNPAKYSDLLQPDDSIKKAISQLEKLSTTYSGMISKVKEEAIKLEVSVKKVNSATEEGRNTTKAAAGEADKLATAQKNLAFSLTEAGKQLAVLKIQQLEQNNLNKLTAKLNSAAEGSYNRLSAQYSINKIKLNQMSAEERAATAAGRQLEAGTRAIYEEMKRLQEATGKNTLNVGNYRNSLEGMSVTINDLTAKQRQLDLSTQQGRASFQAMQAQINQTKASMAQMTATGNTLVTSMKGMAMRLLGAFGLISGVYLFARAVKDTFNRIKEFDAAMQNMAGILGVNRKELSQVESEIKRVASTSVKTSNDVAQLAEVLFTLGKSKQDVINMLEPVNNLAIGLETTSENAANLLGMTLNAFGKGSESAGEFADIIANMRTSTALDFEKIKDALGYLAPTAKAVGMSLGEIGAVIGILQDNGVNAARAGQLMNSSFARLAAKGLTLNDALLLISSSTDKVMTASDLFGKRAFGLGMVLADNQKKLKALGDEFDNLSNGSLKKLTDEQLESMDAKIKILDSTWEKFLLDLDSGDGIIASVSRGFIFAITGMIDALGDLGKSPWKIIADIYANAIVGADRNTLREALIADRQEIERVADTLKAKGIPATQAHEMAVQGLIISYQKLIGFGKGNVTNLNKQVEALRSMTDAAKTEQQITEERLSVEDEIREATQSKIDNEIEAVKDKYSDLITKAKRYGLDYKQLVVIQENEIAKIRKSYAKKGATKEDEEKLRAVRRFNELQILEEKRKNDLIIGANESSIDEKNAAFQQNAKLDSDLVKMSAQNELEDLKKKKESKLINDSSYSAQKKAIEKQLALDLLFIQDKAFEEQKKATEKDLESRDKMYDDKKKTAKEEYDFQLNGIDAQTDLAFSEIDLLKTTEAEKTRLKLKAEQDRLREILRINEEGNKQLSDNEIKIVKNSIEKLDQEIKDPKNQDYDLYALAGITLTDEKKAAIGEATQFAIGQVSNFLQAKIQAAQMAVQAAQKESDAAKSSVDRELEARANGYASNVTMAQKELAMAKKNQADALKEQQRAQKAQAAIETVQQTGSLITASAKIWGTLGFPWAIPALAVMWGSFAASKLQAAKATKQSAVTYGDGGLEILNGGSHASGNDIPIGTTNTGRPRRAEGGEAMAIINKRKTAKYRNILPSIIDSLNKGVFEEKYLNAYAGDQGGGNSFTTIDLSKIESSVDDIRNQGQKKRYRDGDGNEVVVYKNLKRTIISNN